jgi:penicillin-binding protein 2
MQNPEIRIRAITALVAILFILLGARLWELQVVRGDQFATQAVDNRLRMERIPAPRGIIYDRNGKQLVKNAPFYSVALIPELAGVADLGAIADFLGMEVREVSDILGRNRDALEPIRLKEGLTFDEVTFIESRLSDFPALSIDVDETRYYIYGEVGAHVVGYLGKMGPDQIRKADFRDVPRQSFIGQWGVEKMYDAHLRGESGRRMIEVDALGRKHKLVNVEPPRHGSDLFLSIDIDLQEAAEKAFGKHAGALVALKPDSGEVLAIVSRPSFDPNLFSRGIDYDHWLGLVEHEGYPLLNRAVQTQTAPASTFKIISAIAGLEKKTITPKTKFTCKGVIAKGPWKFRCWKRGGHGVMDLHDSLVESCDVYYYLTGEATGISAISQMARRFQLGRKSGLSLVPEKAGLIPDIEWKNRVKGEPWYLGETYNAAIGQGFVLTTPVQLAKMISWVANGGYAYELGLERLDQFPLPAEELGVSGESIDVIRKALRDVVAAEKGTGRSAQSKFLKIAGKTGTAQVVRLREDENRDDKDIPYKLRDHAWFVAFAPAEAPEIAVAVYVEHGGGGGRVAAPIARAAIEAYLVKGDPIAQN